MRILYLPLLLVPSLLCQRPADAPTQPLPSAVQFVTGDASLAAPELTLDVAQDGALWAVGTDYKARLHDDGCTFFPFRGSAAPLCSVALRTTHVAIGGEALATTAPRPAQHDRRFELDRGSFVERFELRPNGVEHSWVFAALPTRGELTLVVQAATELPRQPHTTRVQWADELGGVRYGEAVAIDATGARVDVSVSLTDGALRLTVPSAFVARATMPLVVDPLISTVTVTTGAVLSSAVANVDLACDPLTNEWLVVWSQQFAGTDYDCYVRRYSRSLQSLAARQPIDLTTQSWEVPRVANLARSSRFLIVAEETVSGTIVGRRWSIALPSLAAFTIEATPGVGQPDVGGDPFQGAGTVNWLVAWPRGNELRSVAIDEAGIMTNALSLPAPAAGSPRVQKSNPTGAWLVAFLSDAGLSRNLRTTAYDFFGTPGVVNTVAGYSLPTLFGINSFAISTTQANGTAMIGWDSIGNVTMRPLNAMGAPLAPATSLPTLLGLPNALGSSSAIRIATDGIRFAVAYSENPNRLLASTIAWSAATGFRVDEAPILITSPAGTTFSRPNVASAYGSGATGPHETLLAYQSVTSATGASTIQVANYGAYSSSGGFTTAATACGTPLAITATGTPALGRPVTFAVSPAFPLQGFVFGTPASIPLGGVCACTLGVNGQLLVGGSLALTIPSSLSLVGASVAAQGFTFASGPCLGTVSISNTITMQIR